MKRILGALLMLCLPLLASPAAASCASPAPLEDELGRARTAFVGIVAATSNDDRTATVDVESIWLGETLPQRVEVSGGPDDTEGVSVVSSVDRTWKSGRRYLFVLSDNTPPFTDDACSATTLYTDEVAALEPEGAATPRGDGAFNPWVLVGVALLAVALLQARRAARRAHSIEI